LDVKVSTVKKGDVNNDGSVNTVDFALVKRHILEYEILTGNAFEAADVDGNGTVDTLDYLKIRMYLLEMISEF
ncbi:dockerin type I repeat-containing protein, partial [Anaerobacterium chartisolvens]